MKLALSLFLILIFSSASVFADSKAGDLSVVFGKTYQIHYEAKDSQIQSVQVNKESQSLVFSVSTTSSIASVELILPRELIDATQRDGTDDKFIILVDETFATETEKNPSALTRTIVIPLNSDSKEIEIIGTHLGATNIITQNTTQSPSSPPLVPSPTKPIEQKPIENKTSQQPSSPSHTISQPSQTVPITKSLQEQIYQQISSLLHFKSEQLLQVSKKQIVEYSIIASIALVVIITISSSVRSRHKKSIRK